MLSRIESNCRAPELRSTAAADSAKYCLPIMEISFVDRKFSMAQARRKVATSLSVVSGENLKIALALNSRLRTVSLSSYERN